MNMPHPAPGLAYEHAFSERGLTLVAGLDEAGRGAWAGPVSAGAVILPLERRELQAVLKEVRDSKLCSALQRDRLFDTIQSVALAVGVGIGSVEEIEELGIVQASLLAMRRALDALPIRPQALLIDGGYMRLREVGLPQRSLVRGEWHSLSIAAASIIAKVSRDRLMTELDAEYPGYGFAHHKGYGTPEHQLALRELGPCAIHRRSFKPIQRANWREMGNR
jgi:ribonuclease HII